MVDEKSTQGAEVSGPSGNPPAPPPYAPKPAVAPAKSVDKTDAEIHKAKVALFEQPDVPASRRKIRES